MEFGVMMLLTSLAVGQDLQCGRIRNRVILLGILSGMCFAFLTSDSQKIIVRICGTLLPAAVLYVPYRFRGLGGGDVKLFCMLGSYLGAKRVMACMVCSIVLGAAYGIYLLIRRPHTTAAMHFTGAILASAWIGLEGWY
ncbi:MAG: prepilin peptidase [Lachnospiraceae bacterium]